MTKHEVALVVPILAMALVAPPTQAQQAGPPQPPAAARRPHTTEIHGYTLKDDYFWLRDKTNPEVLKYLESENAYTEEVMRPTKALQETLYGEMLGRIKQTDLERALAHRRLLLLLAHRGGEAVPVHVPAQGQHGRRRGNAARPERAGGGPLLSRPRRLRRQRRRQLAGVFDRYHRLPAVHAAREGPAQAGRFLPRASSASARSCGPATTAPSSTRRRTRSRSGRTSSGGTSLAIRPATCVFEEKDELFDLGAGRSLDKQMIFLACYAKTSTEVRFLPADKPTASSG